MRSRPPASARRTRGRLLAPVLAVILVVLLAPSAHAVAYPPLPIALDREFLGNLSAPTLAPGDSGSLQFSLSDPLSGPISSIALTLEIYAFNAFPGNASSLVAVAGAPELTTATSSGAWANLSVGSLGSNQTYRGSVGVVTASSTPAGAFAVRTALAFTLVSNGTSYRLESRGWFTSAVWSAATTLPNGSVTLNLSVLGVSGVTPETAIYVASSSWDWVLGAVVAAGLVLVGAGAFVYFRRGPGSRSGTR